MHTQTHTLNDNYMPVENNIEHMCTSFQITQNHVVERLLLHYKSDLMKVIKEQRLPYNIDVLAKIRRDCFIQNFNDPNSLQNSQVQVR